MPKSLRIGLRFNVRCSNITTKAGHKVTWHSEIRFLDVYLTAAREYRCSHINTKQSFYRSFNAVIGKIGCCASEDVIVELLKTKCLPSLVYGIEANKSIISSLEFVINNAFRKIFTTKSCDIGKRTLPFSHSVRAGIVDI